MTFFRQAMKPVTSLDRLVSRYGLLPLVRFYQLFLSPLLQPHGSNCRFYPTCSEYASQALQEHGGLIGSWLAARRLLKCHPFHPGGIDLVPEHKHEGPEIIVPDRGADLSADDDRGWKHG